MGKCVSDITHSHDFAICARDPADDMNWLLLCNSWICDHYWWHCNMSNPTTSDLTYPQHLDCKSPDDWDASFISCRCLSSFRKEWIVLSCLSVLISRAMASAHKVFWLHLSSSYACLIDHGSSTPYCMQGVFGHQLCMATMAQPYWRMVCGTHLVNAGSLANPLLWVYLVTT